MKSMFRLNSSQEL